MALEVLSRRLPQLLKGPEVYSAIMAVARLEPTQMLCQHSENEGSPASRMSRAGHRLHVSMVKSWWTHHPAAIP